MHYRRRDVLWRQAGDVLVAATPDGGAPVALVGPPAAIWVALGDDGMTVDDLVALLADTFTVDETAVRETVVAVLADLADQGFVEAVA